MTLRWTWVFVLGVCLGSHICIVASACLQSSCKLEPKTTQGPFYAESMLVREDITEGNAGAPLILNVTVIDTETCQPIVGAAVDIWHCNALGVYSAFQAQGTAGETYLRGIQFTDNNGIASFTTIYPGWYPGRVTHIHVKVHINSTLDSSSGSIIGGHTTHTGQVYFNDTIDAEIAKLAPYSDRASVPLTPQNSDSIFVNQGGIESLLDLQFIDREAEYSGGFVASIILGVESSSAVPQAGSPQATQTPQISPISGGSPTGQTPSTKLSDGSTFGKTCLVALLAVLSLAII